VAERGRAEDLDAAVLLGRILHAPHVHRPGIDAPAVIARDGLAGVPVERLAAARCVEAQQPGAVGAGDPEGVRDASRGAGDAAGADRVLLSVEVTPRVLTGGAGGQQATVIRSPITGCEESLRAPSEP
jgi:hypothetical protein